MEQNIDVIALLIAVFMIAPTLATLVNYFTKVKNDE